MAMELVKLFSCNPEKYPHITKQFEVIENAANLGLYADVSNPIIARKKCIVTARPALLNECISVNPLVEINGQMYRICESKFVVTKQMIEKGMMIVRNPGGELYPVSSYESFIKAYTETEIDNQTLYEAIGEPKPFIPVIKDVKLLKPNWRPGAFQIAPAGSFICIKHKDNPYSVTNVAFEKTYYID